MSDKFFSLLENNSFVFLDGGMGTMLQAHGIKTEHVPELLNIIDPEAIMKIHRLYVESGADVIHISPSHQFPTGITMPVSRRSELLAWSKENGREGRRYIIEDDYDSEFRLAGKPIPPLMAIDRSVSVIYLNTFTKSVSPSIRISYMVLPAGLMKEYREKLGFCSCTVANFEQYILAEFIRQGYFEKHINRMRNYYRQKRDRLLGALKRSELGRYVKVIGADAGLHFLMEVETGSGEEELTERAENQRIRIYGLRHYGSSVSAAAGTEVSGTIDAGVPDPGTIPSEKFRSGGKKAALLLG